MIERLRAGAPESALGLFDAAGLALITYAHWPAHADDPAPAPIAGFIASSFSPLVAEVAGRCLRQCDDDDLVEWADRTAIVIASPTGDVVTAVAVARAVDAGSRVAPLFFFQAVPNAVAGHLAATWRLRGPVVCLSPASTDLAEPIAVAADLLRDGDADAALIVVVTQSTQDPADDRAQAFLVSSVDTAPTRSPVPEDLP